MIEADSAVIARLKGLISEHESMVEKYQKALLAIIGDEKSAPVVSDEPPMFDKPVGFSPVLGNGLNNLMKLVFDAETATFRNTITYILEREGRPMTANELRDNYNALTNKDMVHKDFSPRLSTQIGKSIEKHIVNGNPIESRAFYGLTDWFNVDVLRKEYKDKIRSL